MKKINSEVFGEVLFLTGGTPETASELESLKSLMRRYPANAFGILNKMLNSKGYMLSMEKL